MIKLDMYWYSNPSWYECVADKNGQLTYRFLFEKATPEAIKSYEHWTSQMEVINAGKVE